MRPFLALAPATAAAAAQNLSSVCTTAYIQQSLPLNDFAGLVFKPATITANAVYNATIQGSTDYPGASGVSYCNVTVAYSHNGLNDNVQVWYHLPSPSSYKHRFLATGGGGESINSGESALLQGSVYGAASGLTDAGFGSFSAELTDVLLLGNGTLNYPALYAFAYEAIHEMTEIGKALSRTFYGSPDLYAYYFGCSEGGRDGWSQVQRFQTQFDGAVIGAPAFRQAYQQVNHLVPGVMESVMGYAPPPCELEKINNDTIAACDALDGRVDGVVSRTDLCKLHYDPAASIGKPYSCPAGSSSSGMMMGGAQGTLNAGNTGGAPSASSATTPAQNGTVSAQGVALAKAIRAGLHDSQGRQVYISYQPSAPFTDAQTTYNASTRTWAASASGIAVPWITMFLEQRNTTTLPLAGITYDTLRAWILTGLQKYAGTLQTVWPDLETYRDNGGKVLHFHGESDDSVPAGSSVLYQDSVRRTMYPHLSYDEGYAQLDAWYRLFLIPGGAHCMPSSAQPNGAWPGRMLAQMIAWVEEGVEPVMLNATVQSGARKGEAGKICSFPARPVWSGNASEVQCVVDKEALGSWYPNLTSIPIPVY